MMESDRKGNFVFFLEDRDQNPQTFRNDKNYEGQKCSISFALSFYALFVILFRDSRNGMGSDCKSVWV